MLNKQARNFTKQMNLILVKTHYKSYKSIKQNVHHVNYYFHGEVSNSYYFGFLEGGCTRVGVPYIYMHGRRVACGGAFAPDQFLYWSFFLWIWKTPSGQSGKFSGKNLLEWEQDSGTVSPVVSGTYTHTQCVCGCRNNSHTGVSHE